MSNSEDQKRYEEKVAKLRAKRLAESEANATLKKQNVKESFVYKVLMGTEDPNKITDYIDQWKPESMMQLHDFLGFDEREWLMIVADNRAYPYILQERAFRLGKIAVDKFNYAKLIDEISQKNQDIETIVKSAMDPEATINRLVSLGVMDRVPNYLMVRYKAYGFMQHKLFIDLQDIATVKFDWNKLIKPVTKVDMEKAFDISELAKGGLLAVPPTSAVSVESLNEVMKTVKVEEKDFVVEKQELDKIARVAHQSSVAETISEGTSQLTLEIIPEIAKIANFVTTTIRNSLKDYFGQKPLETLEPFVVHFKVQFKDGLVEKIIPTISESSKKDEPKG
jgi:hypothetical protein